MSGEQLYAQIHNARPKEVTTYLAGYPMVEHSYWSNGVQEIECYDKTKLVKIHNSPKVEMRIIDTRNKIHDFYFDTVLLTDSTFTGLNSRILGTHGRSIKLADIKKVKLQKGTKGYKYRLPE
jgi:hypothetical protein